MSYISCTLKQIVRIILKRKNTFKSNIIKVNSINIIININKGYIINKINTKIENQRFELKI